MPKSILVVDNEPRSRELIAQFLREATNQFINK
jgi:CheY-like chemotaxis protein